MYVHNNVLKITTIRLLDIWNQKVYLNSVMITEMLELSKSYPIKSHWKWILTQTTKQFWSFFTLNNKPILNQ